MNYLPKVIALSAVVLMLAGASAIQVLQATPQGVSLQQEQPLVAPPGREAMYRRAWEIPSLIKGGVITPRWMADGNRFWHADGSPDHTVIYTFDPTTRTKTPLFDSVRLRAALTQVLGHEPPFGGLPFDTFTFLDQERSVKFAVDGEEYVMPLATYAITRLTPPSRQERARSGPPPRPNGRGRARHAGDALA